LEASSTSPSVGQSITFTAMSPMNKINLGGSSWRSSDDTIVSVQDITGGSTTGQAHKVGKATVTVTAEGKSASVTITVIAAVGNVMVTGDTSLDLGAESTYTAAVTDQDGKPITNADPKWVASGSVSIVGSSSGASVKIRATGVGNGSVTASAGTKAGQVAVTVSVGASATLSIASADGTTLPTMLAVNQEVTIKAQYVGTNMIKADARDATFTGTGACAVDAVGNGVATVQGTGSGTCTVKATAMGKMAMVTFELVNITSVKITADNSTLKLGATRNVMAVAMNGTTAVTSVQVTWTQTGPSVVSIAPMGTTGTYTLTGTAVGPAMLTASAGAATAQLAFAVDPVTLDLAVVNGTTNVPMNGSATVTVTPKGMGGGASRFVSATGVTLSGAAGFGTVGAAAFNAQTGLVSFTLANATAASPAVTAKYSDVTSNALAFTIMATPSTVNWEGTCVASPMGVRAWRVSGFQGATASGGGAIVYDVYAALGAAATTASTKVANDGASGIAKDVTVASNGADWRFGVVARAADNSVSGLVACTRGVTVASSAVAGNAILLGGSGVFADDTTMAVAATNPRALLMVAPANSALERTAPRPSISFGGGLMGIGVANNGQILYKRPGSGQGADASVLPTMLATVKTDASGGVCTSRAGVTAFELAGKTSAGGALTSFGVYTVTATATGDVGDCALNVLAFREGATKTIASGVDRAAAFGDHRLGYLYGGALFDVDLVSTSKVPRQLADDGLAAGSLLAAANPTTGTAGAIEATSVFVLSPTGVVSRYTVGAPPLAAPVTSAATASLANADGLAASSDGATLYVTVGGVLKVVGVSGAGPLSLTVTARDYASVGGPTVTLGSSAAAAP
jgi:hypothetical protein